MIMIFVLQVWLLLFLSNKLIDHFDSIDIWTDGGPHHFKTRYCQAMWYWLSCCRFAARRSSHHFFASFHTAFAHGRRRRAQVLPFSSAA
jgi:hypothetical protein